MVEFVAVVLQAFKLQCVGLVEDLVGLAKALLTYMDEKPEQRPGRKILRIGDAKECFECGPQRRRHFTAVDLLARDVIAK